MSAKDQGEGDNVAGLPTEFRFDQSPVRAVVRDGEPWFVAKDLCDILDIANPRDAIAEFDDDVRGVVTTDTPGGPQTLNAVNESGLYRLIFASRKREAKRFRKWVTREVLPEIRKTGGYGRPEPEFEALSGEYVN
jgi:prophage antirepressor-like protein